MNEKTLEYLDSLIFTYQDRPDESLRHRIEALEAELGVPGRLEAVSNQSRRLTQLCSQAGDTVRTPASLGGDIMQALRAQERAASRNAIPYALSAFAAIAAAAVLLLTFAPHWIGMGKSNATQHSVTPAPEAAVDLATLELQAVVGDYVLLRDGAGRQKMYTANDTIAGFTITKIEEDHLQLSAGGNQVFVHYAGDGEIDERVIEQYLRDKNLDEERIKDCMGQWRKGRHWGHGPGPFDEHKRRFDELKRKQADGLLTEQEKLELEKMEKFAHNCKDKFQMHGLGMEIGMLERRIGDMERKAADTGLSVIEQRELDGRKTLLSILKERFDTEQMLENK